jgi:hypothetical protein
MNRRDQQRFWTSVPLRSLAIVLAAIFCTFGSLGFLTDIAGQGSRPLWAVAVNVTSAGLIAVGIGICAMRGWKYLPLPFLVQAGTILLQRRSPGVPLSGAALESRLQLDASGCLLCVMLGYGLFIGFIAHRGVGELRLQTEIALARELHEVLVPALDRRIGRYAVYGRSFASNEVGGDLLDVVARPDGLTCYVADVSGHGVPAGALMGMLKSAMRMRLRADGTLPGVLMDVNQVLLDLKKSNMFVTWAGVQLTPGGAATFALAGHLPILHYRKATASITRLSVSHVPLGILASEEFTTGAAQLEPGDVLALLTDGLTEVMDRGDQELGLERIEEILRREAGTQPLSRVFDAILAAVTAHGKRQDDQTLLLVGTFHEI